MKIFLAIIKIVLLIIVLLLLFSLRGINEKYIENYEINDRKDSIFQSEVIDVSHQGFTFIYLNDETWPSSKYLNDEILIIDLVLKQSKEISCENDLRKSKLVLKIAAFSKNESGKYSRLVHSERNPSDTIQLSQVSTYGNTDIQGYTFTYPLGNLCFFHGNDISIELEVIEGDEIINTLQPIISVKKYSKQTRQFVFKPGFFDQMFYFTNIILVLIVLLMEIISLIKSEVNS